MQKNINKKKIENELQKALALEFVKDYCKQNNYSTDKLASLKFELLYNECAFLKSSGKQIDGLIHDIETLPEVILLIKYDSGKLVIEETNYTKKYLS